MLAAKIKREANLIEGPFLKKIIFFILPVLFTSLLQSLYNSADLAVVGHFRGDLALAAVGSTGSITNLTVCLFLGLSVGAGVVLSNSIGARDHRMARKTVHTSVLLAVSLGIITMIIGLVGAPHFLRWMDTPDTVIDNATLYMRIIFLGIPAQMLYNYCATMIRSAGDTKHPLIFLSISGVVNVLLNLFFIAICGMGVDGVALATIISQYLSAAMTVIFMYRSDSDIQLRFKELHIDPTLVKRILKIGIPSGIQSAMFSISNVAIQSSINSLGDIAVAGCAAAANIDGWVYIACNSGYHAALAFVGQNMGARRYENIKKITLFSTLCVVVIGILLGGLILITPTTFLNIFTSGDAAVLDAGLSRLYVVLPLYFLCGIMEVLSGVLRGMGKSMHTMIVAIVTSCVLRVVWVNTVFLISPKLTTIFAVYPITWGLGIIAYAIMIVFYSKKLLRTTVQEGF